MARCALLVRGRSRAGPPAGLSRCGPPAMAQQAPTRLQLAALWKVACGGIMGARRRRRKSNWSGVCKQWRALQPLGARTSAAPATSVTGGATSSRALSRAGAERQATSRSHARTARWKTRLHGRHGSMEDMARWKTLYPMLENTSANIRGKSRPMSLGAGQLTFRTKEGGQGRPRLRKARNGY